MADYMDVEEFRAGIGERIGLNGVRIGGESISEIMENAGKILQAFNEAKQAERETEAPAAETEIDKFEKWFNSRLGIDVPCKEPVTQLEAPQPNMYPSVRDGGEQIHITQNDMRTPQQKFSEWFDSNTTRAFDSWGSDANNGWTRIL